MTIRACDDVENNSIVGDVLVFENADPLMGYVKLKD